MRRLLMLLMRSASKVMAIQPDASRDIKIKIKKGGQWLRPKVRFSHAQAQ
jgi:hypothetical protein